MFNLFGGQPGDFALPDGQMNIYGGDAGRNATIAGVVNLYGGTLQDNFFGASTGVLNIYGEDFAVDGVPILGLAEGNPTALNARDVTLTGSLSDGTSFSYTVNELPSGVFGETRVEPGFRLNLIVAPEPNAMLCASGLLMSVGACRRSF